MCNMKYLKNTIPIFLFLVIVTACKKSDEDVEIVESENSASYFQKKMNNLVLMDSLHKRVVNQGDTIAYFHIQSIYSIGEQKRTSALYYALIMANKYNYKQAYKDVYEILDSKTIDKKTKKMADEYLLKSK